jgi:hypothetical protein
MTIGEWDQRQLCPDGGCVGVIGPDGTCKVCGRVAPNWGDERNRGLNPPEDDLGAAEDDGDDDALGANGDGHGEAGEDEDEDEDEAGEDGEAGAGAENGEAPDGEWPERELCSDGTYIGVIGGNGRCKVCGKPGASPRAVAHTASATDAPPAVAADDEPPTAAERPDDLTEAAAPAANSTDPEAKS